ncbi:glutamyl-tRNA reductase [Microbacterium gorillae]|uniref:glutamyl-tRNA reductase n=1 Tax=Microbacterium gorillae TaxID=1231063 RepID=UPI000590F32A|nr:glutamyl-tRNA reductase [Microbacterium gorillae]
MLVSLGAHQRTSSFATLERLAALGSDIGTRIEGAHPGIAGVVIVSTCNRFEAHLDIADEHAASPVPAVDAAIETIAAAAGLPFREVRDALLIRSGNRGVHHLFATASGLDSVALGEDEIAGQVARALSSARDAGVASAPLERLFQRAASVSRVVKNEVGLAASGRSLVRVAVAQAGASVRSWPDATVLLVGTGRYAAVSLAALRDAGARNIAVHSPSGRADFAARHALTSIGAADLTTAIARTDVVVSCTSATDGPVLTADLWPSAPHDQVVLDLGMPRNVDAEVSRRPGVRLLDLDTIASAAAVDEPALLERAQRLIAAAVREHAAADQLQRVSGAVTDLRSYVNDVLDRELARVGGDPRTEPALRHFAGVLMHGLITQGTRAAARGDGPSWRAAVAAVVPGDPAP